MENERSDDKVALIGRKGPIWDRLSTGYDIATGRVSEGVSSLAGIDEHEDDVESGPDDSLSTDESISDWGGSILLAETVYR